MATPFPLQVSFCVFNFVLVVVVVVVVWVPLSWLVLCIKFVQLPFVVDALEAIFPQEGCPHWTISMRSRYDLLGFGFSSQIGIRIQGSHKQGRVCHIKTADSQIGR